MKNLKAKILQWKISCSNGFTLVELIVVLGIIAVLSTTSLVTTRGIQRRTLNNTSLTLQANMRYAQRMAVIEGRRWRVVFDKEYNRYHMHPVVGLGNLVDRSYTIYLPSGIEFEHLGRPMFEYLPRGTIGGRDGVFGTGTAFTMELRSGPYIQRMTANVSAGRIAIFDIERR